MWLMLQQDIPDDYAVATGETRSVLEFVQMAFEMVNLGYQKYVVTDPLFYRPAEVDLLIGNATKARASLEWSASTSFAGLVHEMIEGGCRALGVEVPGKHLSVSV